MRSAADCWLASQNDPMPASSQPYVEFAQEPRDCLTVAHPRSRQYLPCAVASLGLVALAGAAVTFSMASSQHAAAQASLEQLEQLIPKLQAAAAASTATTTALSLSTVPHKFAIDGVTPTDFQMQRGDCWLFATVGILEDSYRRYGVSMGWLAPDQYLHLSRQAFGVAVLDECLKHTDACAFDGDAIYTGNSTTGGEVELIYYLKQVGAGALPWSVCDYVPTPIADRKCDGRKAALAVNPLRFDVRTLTTLYNRDDIKAALVRGGRALGLSTAMIELPYWLPCTSETAAQLRCDPNDEATCDKCPVERAYAGVKCCVQVKRPQYNLRAEWYHRPGEPIIKEGGHSIALVGWNDRYRTESGLTGGWIIRNSWEDGLGLSHGAPVRGSRSLDYFMHRHSDSDELTVCPNSRDPRNWYACTDLAACGKAETVMFAKTAHRVLQLECLDSGFYAQGACVPGEQLYLKDQGGGQGLETWGGGLSQACFIRALTGEEFCMPPLPVDDLGTIVQPAAGEERPNRKDLCGFYFVPYETLEAMEAALGGVWVSDFDITWAPQSYAANGHLPEYAAKYDYSLVKADTHTMHPVHFSGPLPHLVAPYVN